MVYLLKMVIFHGELLNNQMLPDLVNVSNKTMEWKINTMLWMGYFFFKFIISTGPFSMSQTVSLPEGNT